MACVRKTRINFFRKDIKGIFFVFTQRIAILIFTKQSTLKIINIFTNDGYEKQRLILLVRIKLQVKWEILFVFFRKTVVLNGCARSYSIQKPK